MASSSGATASIVVAVRNGAATIVPCIESVLALDYPASQRELIVVDNASTDDTPKLLARFGSQLRVVWEGSLGPAAARNAGIREAQGAVVAFTDADCVVDSGWLSYLLGPLQDPAVGIVGGRILALRPCNRIALFGERIHDHRRAIEEFDPPYAITMNWASPRRVLQEMGCFNPALLRGSDSEMAFRIGARGYRLVYCHEAVIFHRNETSLGGLFAEGRAHGKGNEMTRAARGRPRFLQALNPRLRARELGRSVARIATGPERPEAVFETVFDFGKLVGRCLERLRPTR